MRIVFDLMNKQKMGKRKRLWKVGISVLAFNIHLMVCLIIFCFNMVEPFLSDLFNQALVLTDPTYLNKPDFHTKTV